MISPGFETTDPVTQTRTVVLQGARETSGRGWVIEVHCPEGAAPAFLAHVHRTWTETFEILQGAATCRLGASEVRLAAGESIVMPPRVPHVHPWNTGSGVQLAATGRAMTKHGAFDVAMPISLQVGLSATLGRLAEVLGYRAVYDRYLR